MESLHRHRTIRKFTTQAVCDSVLESILFSGTRASTTGNMQLYSVIATRNPELKDKLASCHFSQSAAKTAPVLLTFIADFNRFSKWCLLNDAVAGFANFLSFYNASVDALLAAQNTCIAAENYGLGICYLGTTVYNAEEIIDVLNLPKLTFPVTAVALGYPDESPELTDRLPLHGIMHHEKYLDYSTEKINEIYSFKENLESSKKFVFGNNKKTLAQVYTDVRYKKTDNEYFSVKMIETLKKQGFLD